MFQKPYDLVQVTILVRRPDDEILLMASDGLWDVLNNQEACTLARRCLRRARQRGASRQSAARIAATVLTRAAVDRGSRDNVTVSFQAILSFVLILAKGFLYYPGALLPIAMKLLASLLVYIAKRYSYHCTQCRAAYPVQPVAMQVYLSLASLVSHDLWPLWNLRLQLASAISTPCSRLMVHWHMERVSGF